MTPRVRAWLLILVLFALCAASVAGVVWYRSRTVSTAAMIKRLPADEALVVFIDFSQLRRAGILQLLDGSKVGEDPEYRSFVSKTEFDYKQDLDAAMVAFAPTGRYMLLRGRFDWKSLYAYVKGADGRCNNSFCRLTGSTEDRRISFYPVQRGLMALAVSPEDSAALRMNLVEPREDFEIPNAPVWLSIPPSVVRSGQSLPAGTQMFARSLERAQAVTLAMVPEGDRFAAKLNVRCASEQDAAELSSQLTRTTSLLLDLIRREKQTPNASDLSGFLTSGTFRSEGRRVFGYWPIQRSFVQNMLGGG